MKKTLITRIVFVVGIILLLILQYIWTYNMYESVSKSLVDNSKVSFVNATSYEIFHRVDKKITMVFGGQQSISGKKNSGDGDIDFALPINELYNSERKYMNYSVVDSFYSQEIKKSFGFIPSHKITKLTDIKRIKDLRESRSNTSVYNEGENVLIYQRIGGSEWVQLILINPSGVVLAKSLWIFIISIVLALFLVFIIFHQYRIMNSDRKFVSFLIDYTRVLAQNLRIPIESIKVLLSRLNSNDKLSSSENHNLLSEGVYLSNKIIDNLDMLLYLAKYETKGLQIVKLPVLLDILIDRIIVRYQNNNYTSRIIEFSKEVEPDCILMIDVTLFENIISCLLEIILQNSGLKSEVFIHAIKVDKCITISVLTNAQKLSAEAISKIIKSEPPKANVNYLMSDFSIYLTFINKVIQAHGGVLFVESEKNYGVRFVIRLPYE